jgi:hypothetical protein
VFIENMKIPAITGIIRRRILLNYRVAPDVAQAILPGNFRPKLIAGHAIAGICLIRLEQIRPKGMPGIFGISSENSAHRIAVEWEDDSRSPREGVFVPRRDTDSRLNALAGGRIFPGTHHLSRFTVNDQDDRISLSVVADDIAPPLVDFCVSAAEEFPETSIFGGLPESSRFFKAGCVGYSSRSDSSVLDGLLLEVENWSVFPLTAESVRSAYFDDSSIFPPGSIEFDHALLMRDIQHQWHSEPSMIAKPAAPHSSNESQL